MQTGISKDGRFLAYALSTSGSDWRTIKVLDVESPAEPLSDCIQYVKFSSIDWTHDNRGFF